MSSARERGALRASILLCRGTPLLRWVVAHAVPHGQVVSTAGFLISMLGGCPVICSGGAQERGALRAIENLICSGMPLLRWVVACAVPHGQMTVAAGFLTHMLGMRAGTCAGVAQERGALRAIDDLICRGIPLLRWVVAFCLALRS